MNPKRETIRANPRAMQNGRWLGTLCNSHVISPAVQQHEQKLGQGSKTSEQLPLCVIKCVIGATYTSHPRAAASPRFHHGLRHKLFHQAASQLRQCLQPGLASVRCGRGRPQVQGPQGMAQGPRQLEPRLLGGVRGGGAGRAQAHIRAAVCGGEEWGRMRHSFGSVRQALRRSRGRHATTQHRRGAGQEGVQHLSCSTAAQRSVRTCAPQQRDLCALAQLGSGEEGHKLVQHRLVAPAPGSREGRRHAVTHNSVTQPVLGGCQASQHALVQLHLVAICMLRKAQAHKSTCLHGVLCRLSHPTALLPRSRPNGTPTTQQHVRPHFMSGRSDSSSASVNCLPVMPRTSRICSVSGRRG